MDKLENVIKGLERFIADFKPFYGNKSDWQRVDDALALLKAQKETIPIDFLMRYAQLPTEFAISAWKKPIRDALKNKAKDTDKPMSFDDALQLVNGIRR